MARKLKNRSETDFLLKKVLGDAQHHAEGMIGPVNSIYSYMIKLLDFDRDLVEVFERNGEIARTTWVTLQGCRMVFKYDYAGKCVLLKQDSLRGKTRASFYWNEKKEATVDSLNKAMKKMGVSC